MIIDLTHTLHPDIPLFPGTPEPRLQQIASIAFDGFNEKMLTFASHTGTHMDAPNHILPDTQTLDTLPVDKFIGKACLIDCRNTKTIDTQVITRYSHLLEKADFALLLTGWEHKWNTGDYLNGFPTLSPNAAKQLCQFNLKGVGLDAISVDPIDSTDLPIHKILLSNNLVIIENLTNLSMLPGNKIFDFIALPLKTKDADGAPVRAIAII